jgi:hypothetical protein
MFKSISTSLLRLSITNEHKRKIYVRNTGFKSRFHLAERHTSLPNEEDITKTIDSTILCPHWLANIYCMTLEIKIEETLTIWFVHSHLFSVGILPASTSFLFEFMPFMTQLFQPFEF